MNDLSFSHINYSDPRLLLDSVQQLRQAIYEEGQATFKRWRPSIRSRDYIISALNLAYYLALRQHDIRPLQSALTSWGLSSLGRTEARVMPNLDAVIATLSMICGEPAKHPRMSLFYRGQRLLQRHTDAVFGRQTDGRPVRIMVTMPDEAAEDYRFALHLLEAGMDCIRLNCAHGGPDKWTAVIRNLRKAESETGRACKVAMDLTGPRLRTDTIMVPHGRRLYAGDTFRINTGTFKSAHKYPIQASCTLPDVLKQVKAGARVWIDEGKLGAEVVEAGPDGLVLKVTHARHHGEKLKTGKGLNFPDTTLHLPALTPKDLQDLDFVAQHADIINYSFVQEATDIAMLQDALASRSEHPERIAIVAKIETKRAISNLPELIIQAGGRQPFGVMIARGDLAVEIGYDRLAEMQEQILWLCEAAHVPVIWATQVLERLVKKGTPSRAEVTDAAMSERAECVLLNKGPYISEAIVILDQVLARMQAHQLKKTAMLRALGSWALEAEPEEEIVFG